MSLDTAAILAEATSLVSGASASDGDETTETTETLVGTKGDKSGGEKATDQKGEETLSWADALKASPPELQKLLRSMQADYTRKTQSLAEERKAFQAERAALAKGRAGLKAPEKMPEWDPWSEESVSARIEAEVQKRLNEALAPVEQSYKEAQANSAYNSFVAENPDLATDQDLRMEVGKLLNANENLDLETAYWAVKGRMSKTRAATETTRVQAHREAHRKAALATGAPRKAPTLQQPKVSELKKMSTEDILALAKQMNNR